MKPWKAIFVFLVGTATPAAAAEFYIFTMDEISALIIEPNAIATTGDGHRIAEISRVSGGFGTRLLDTTRMEMDCAGSRWRTISELLYDLSSEDKSPIDKTHLSGTTWGAVPEKTVAKEMMDFVCAWPQAELAKDATFSAPDISAAVEALGRFFDEQVLREMDEDERKELLDEGE